VAPLRWHVPEAAHHPARRAARSTRRLQGQAGGFCMRR
jgi:hypothetical protein